MGYRDYSVAKGHIVDVTGHGDFTTVSAAIAAASSGQTIFIRPGTYTENPTLKAGVDLVAFTGEDINVSASNVIINGKCTYAEGGNAGLYGITLQTNSDYCLVISGASAGNLNLIQCNISATNNTAINFTNSNSGATLFIDGGETVISGSAITLYTMSSPGVIQCFYHTINYTNVAVNSTPSNNSAGDVAFFYSVVYIPTSTSGTGALNFLFCQIFPTGGGFGVPAVNLEGNSGFTCFYTSITAPAQSCIKIGAAAAWSVVYCQLSSDATNVIDGTGTLAKAYLVFTGLSSGIAGTLTVTTYTTA